MNNVLRAKLILESRGYRVTRLTEMAMNRSDAIDRCCSLGSRFIEHFKKIYQEKDTVVVNHWCDEMNAWYHEANEITIKPKNKRINYTQLVDWFFTRGSSTEILFSDSDEEELLYNKFIVEVYSTDDVKRALVNIGLVSEEIFSRSKHNIYKNRRV